MAFGRVVTVDDVKNILFEGSPNYQDAWKKINKILERTPTDPRALALKAKVFCLMKSKEFAVANDEKKTVIRDEAIRYADAVIGTRKSPKCYKAKERALQCLDQNDPELLEIRRTTLLQALDLDPQSSDARFFSSMLSQIDAAIGGGGPRKRAPIVAFKASSTTGTAPYVVQFQDSSLHLTPGSTWVWNFGDGTTSQIQNPSHEYSREGSFTVTLTVTNDYGSTTKVQTGYINIKSREGDGREAFTDPIDPDTLYQKVLIDLVNGNTEIIDRILDKQEQKLQVKGYLYDAFDGETPMALYVLINCIDEMIPFTIWEYRNDSVIMNTRLDIRKRALIARGYSENSIDWGIKSWKNALSPHFKNATPGPEREDGDLELTF